MSVRTESFRSFPFSKVQSTFNIFKISHSTLYYIQHISITFSISHSTHYIQHLIFNILHDLISYIKHNITFDILHSTYYSQHMILHSTITIILPLHLIYLTFNILHSTYYSQHIILHSTYYHQHNTLYST